MEEALDLSFDRLLMTMSEYHHLFPQLKADGERVFQYFRMDIETFTYILGKIEHRLIKNWCNLHQKKILPEERLVITLR